MARLPVLHKRQPSKGQQVLDLTKRAAKVWVAAKLSVKGIRHARRGAKAYGTAKSVGRPAMKVAIPVVVAGSGVVVWRKLKNGSSGNGGGDETSRPIGPVAHAETVSPPADAAVQTAGSEAPSSS
jgi:hypothetical protein